jgi:hypothetical protein
MTLANIWAIKLFSRHCDICKDFRLEIFIFYIGSEAPRPKRRGFCLTAVLRSPGKDFFQFHIAPLDPALKGGACGEQTGQAFYPQNPNIFTGLEIDNTTGVRYLNPSRRLPQSGHNGVDTGTKW